MNIVIITAGGVGSRMGASIPKQFLTVAGKPIIVYTIEQFNRHKDIDGIVISCVEEWMDSLKEMVCTYNLNKVISVTKGGATGQDSIFNGLLVVSQLYGEDHLVMVHDAVRPMINAAIIAENIAVAQQKGCCITCNKATETVGITNGNSLTLPNRETCVLVRAPQTFRVDRLIEAHKKAQKEGIHTMTDSCTLYARYNSGEIPMVIGPIDNIKITTKTDLNYFDNYVKETQLG